MIVCVYGASARFSKGKITYKKEHVFAYDLL